VSEVKGTRVKLGAMRWDVEGDAPAALKGGWL